MNRQNNSWKSPGEEGQSFSWGQFEQLFNELFPNAVPQVGSISRIGQFVQDVVERTMPDNRDAAVSSDDSGQPLFHAETSVTERFVKVRIIIPEHIDPRKLQLFVNGLTLRIEGPVGHTQAVRLPVPVAVKSMQAVYRDNALHIRLHKKTAPGYKELYVRYP